jgi:hypothetical protein
MVRISPSHAGGRMTRFIGYNMQSVVGARMAAINGEGLDGV